MRLGISLDEMKEQRKIESKQKIQFIGFKECAMRSSSGRKGELNMLPGLRTYIFENMQTIPVTVRMRPSSGIDRDVRK